ncbi:hypothetical protein PR048_029331 [Dryococelus australis]|uniref:Uncharacterized protein n=1 Tax=Dryococelus australis TaxID=614101 RepID=A0ABQ9GD25_9NEOP|nr:hypothetical protein PR048_029331 [Dryococelus australis]
MAGLNIAKLPESVDLQSPNARKEWEIFEGDFESYLVATSQDECPDKVKIALLENMLGALCLKPLTLPQRPEALLQMENATVAKVAVYYRAAEQCQEQAKHIQAKNYVLVRRNANVDFVDAKSRQFSKPRVTNNTAHNSNSEYVCSQCQTQHKPRPCPAYGKKCAKCGILNHFAVCCKVRRVREVKVDHSSNESLYCDTVTIHSVGPASSKKVRQNEWRERRVLIEGRSVDIKLDPGSEVNTLPFKLFQTVDQQFKVHPTNLRIEVWGGTILPV